MDNIFVKLYIEVGIIGLGLFIAFLTVCFQHVLRAWRLSAGRIKYLLSGLLALYVAIVFHSLFESTLAGPNIMFSIILFIVAFSKKIYENPSRYTNL